MCDDLENNEQPEDTGAYSAEEVRGRFLKHLWNLIMYWDRAGTNPRDKMEGVVFSLLSTIDGTTLSLPRMRIVLDPHPDDKEFHIGEGEKYFEDGMVLNGDGVSLHEEWGRHK